MAEPDPEALGEVAAPDRLLPPPYRAPGQGSLAARIGGAIIGAPIRAAMYPGRVFLGEANPYEGTEAVDWAAQTGMGMIGRGVTRAPEGAIGATGGRMTQPAMGDIAASSGMDALNDVLRTTTNRGIIDSLPSPPTTHAARIAARTKGMSDAGVLGSDELWAMTRDLMAQRPQSFSSAYSKLAAGRLGRPLTPEEVSTAMLDAARAGIATPRKLYEPER